MRRRPSEVPAIQTMTCCLCGKAETGDIFTAEFGRRWDWYTGHAFKRHECCAGCVHHPAWQRFLRSYGEIPPNGDTPQPAPEARTTMTEIITRACGHDQAFTPRGDRYDDARRAKLRAKRCGDCGRAQNEADNLRHQQAAGRIRKGTEVKHLPPGTAVTLLRNDDGTWAGRLSAGGVEVEASVGGAMGIVSKLARKWLQRGGEKLHGKA